MHVALPLHGGKYLLPSGPHTTLLSVTHAAGATIEVLSKRPKISVLVVVGDRANDYRSVTIIITHYKTGPPLSEPPQVSISFSCFTGYATKSTDTG